MHGACGARNEAPTPACMGQHERGSDSRIDDVFSNRCSLGTAVGAWTDNGFKVRPHVLLCVRFNLEVLKEAWAAGGLGGLAGWRAVGFCAFLLIFMGFCVFLWVSVCFCGFL